MRDFYFGIEELPGPIVKEEDGLIQAIQTAGKENFVPDETYVKFNDKFNPYRKPCSAEVLEEIIG
jgi:CDP-glycerol glycerophosphotransferase